MPANNLEPEPPNTARSATASGARDRGDSNHWHQHDNFPDLQMRRR
ncbi:MAG: hypothetical protein MI924_08620 [Chloroflexales bacterium]|nr:hypothetical protein [Chloroflexales bacterium]